MSTTPRWTVLRPQSLGADISVALQARLHDPAWMLCRQWQLAEFQAEDAGTPACVEYQGQHARLTHWRARGALRHSLDELRPVEAQTVAEGGAFDDLATRAELGRLLEGLWEAHGVAEASRATLRAAHGIAGPGSADRGLPAQERAFRRLMAGQLDGRSLLRWAQALGGHLRATLHTAPWSMTGDEAERVEAALTEALKLLGPLHLGRTPDAEQAAPSTWDRERLEHTVWVETADEEKGARLRGRPDDQGDLDWYSFDVERLGSPAFEDGESLCVLPSQVRFKGMPNHRWWDLEDSASALAGLQPGPDQIGHAVFLDFLLVAGNDWFQVPLRLPLGALARLKNDVLRVRDVFGETTEVKPAKTSLGDAQRRCTLFSSPLTGGSAGTLAPWLLVPPVGGHLAIDGPVLEEIQFARDEQANLAWALEVLLTDPLGRARRTSERTDLSSMPLAATPPSRQGWRYRVQTEVPAHWIPFVPVRARGSTDWEGQIGLRRARLWSQERGLPVAAHGRVLRAPDEANGAYTLAEEELPREGLTVLRSVARGRGSDGSTCTWVRWHRRVGRGEAASGLRYDILEPDR